MATSSSTSTFSTTVSFLSSGERHSTSSTSSTSSSSSSSSSSASSTSSIINTSIPEEEELDDSKLQRIFGRRSIIVQDWDSQQQQLSPPSSLSTRRIPKLFKGLKSTRSTPLPGTTQISLYNCDDNNERRELFASDAIVNHPLRIGIG